jgi:hypothetical protein
MRVSSFEPEPHLQQGLERAGLPERSWVQQLDGLRWVDGRDGRLVDDLCSIASDKLDCEIVERSDLALEPDPIRQKHGDLNSLIANLLQERVLEG